MFYNGKKKNGFERIGMAVSKDMIRWHRYGENQWHQRRSANREDRRCVDDVLFWRGLETARI